MKKKVLVVNTAGLCEGGITSHMINYISALKEHCSDFKFTIVVTIKFSDEVIKQFKNIGCSVVFLPDRKKQLLKYMSKLHSLMCKEKFDIIHVHGNSSTMSIELFIAKLVEYEKEYHTVIQLNAHIDFLTIY